MAGIFEKAKNIFSPVGKKIEETFDTTVTSLEGGSTPSFFNQDSLDKMPREQLERILESVQGAHPETIAQVENTLNARFGSPQSESIPVAEETIDGNIQETSEPVPVVQLEQKQREEKVADQIDQQVAINDGRITIEEQSSQPDTTRIDKLKRNNQGLDKVKNEKVLNRTKRIKQKTKNLGDVFVDMEDKQAQKEGFTPEYLEGSTEPELKQLLAKMEKEGDDANYRVVEEALGKLNPHFAPKEQESNSSHKETEEIKQNVVETLSDKEKKDQLLDDIQKEYQEKKESSEELPPSLKSAGQAREKVTKADHTLLELTEALQNGTLDALQYELQRQNLEHKKGFWNKLGMYGSRLGSMYEGVKKHTWYGKYVDWMNKGPQWQRLAKRIAVGAVIGATTGGAGLAVAGGLTAARVLASAGAGALAGEIHKQATKSKLEKNIGKYDTLLSHEQERLQGSLNEDKQSTREETIGSVYSSPQETIQFKGDGKIERSYSNVNEERYQSLRNKEKEGSLTEQEKDEFHTLTQSRNKNRETLKYLNSFKNHGTGPKGYREFGKEIKEARSHRAEELLKARKEYWERRNLLETSFKGKMDSLNTSHSELKRRLLMRNERNRNMVSAAAGLLTGLGMHYGELLDSFQTSPDTVSEPTPIPDGEGIPIPEQVPTPENFVSGDAIIHKGEGITHALLRQLQNNPELRHAFGIEGTPTGQDAAQIAKEFGYIGNDGSEVRVLDGQGAAYQLSIDEQGNPFVKEFKGGQLVDGRYEGGDFVERHDTGSFEGEDTDHYEYLYNKGTSASGGATVHHDPFQNGGGERVTGHETIYTHPDAPTPIPLSDMDPFGGRTLPPLPHELNQESVSSIPLKTPPTPQELPQDLTPQGEPKVILEQKTGPFEIRHDREGGDLSVDEHFKFEGAVDTDGFSNREMRLIERGKYETVMNINDDRFGMFNRVRIVQLRNGQFALEMAGVAESEAGAQIMAQQSTKNILETFKMPSDPAYFQTSQVEGSQVVRAYTPLSEDQARFIGKTYGDLVRALNR